MVKMMKIAILGSGYFTDNSSNGDDSDGDFGDDKNVDWYAN